MSEDRRQRIFDKLKNPRPRLYGEDVFRFFKDNLYRNLYFSQLGKNVTIASRKKIKIHRWKPHDDAVDALDILWGDDVP